MAKKCKKDEKEKKSLTPGKQSSSETQSKEPPTKMLPNSNSGPRMQMKHNVPGITATKSIIIEKIKEKVMKKSNEHVMKKLKDGESEDVISENISILINEGYDKEQATALAYEKAGVSKSMKKARIYDEKGGGWRDRQKDEDTPDHEYHSERGWQSLQHIQSANERLGHHWFDKDAMKFFGTKFHGDVRGGKYFVTSDQDQKGFGRLGHAWGGQRKYSVREASPKGEIHEVSEFGQFSSSKQAHSHIDKLITSKKVKKSLEFSDEDLMPTAKQEIKKSTIDDKSKDLDQDGMQKSQPIIHWSTKIRVDKIEKNWNPNFKKEKK